MKPVLHNSKLRSRRWYRIKRNYSTKTFSALKFWSKNPQELSPVVIIMQRGILTITIERAKWENANRSDELRIIDNFLSKYQWFSAKGTLFYGVNGDQRSRKRIYGSSQTIESKDRERKIGQGLRSADITFLRGANGIRTFTTSSGNVQGSSPRRPLRER